MASKYTDFFDSSRTSRPKYEGKLETPKFDRPKFENRYSLPEDIKRKEEIKKEFKDYLTHKEEGFDRGYVPPPFEASKVPSPYYGFKKPKTQEKKVVDYTRLKNNMTKKSTEFIILETFSTPQLEAAWKSHIENNDPKRSHSVNSHKHTEALNKTRKQKVIRSHGLHRTLESIMNEEQSGNNNSKRNVPGYFNDK